MRKAGEMLGVSHQRIKQLADRGTHGGDSVDLLERPEAEAELAMRERADCVASA